MVKRQLKKNKVPLGIKLIALYQSLFAIFFVIAAILSFTQPSTAAIAGGVINIVAAALNVILAYNIYNGKNWAKIVTLILIFLNALVAVVFIIKEMQVLLRLLYIVIDISIISYLLSSPTAKSFFKK